MSPPARKFWTVGGLLVILVVASVLRVVRPGTSPPGLNQDEAANAWGAYCLLNTGRDQVGQPWPILYTRSIGDNRSTLYLYLLLPFQAVGGMNAITTRLPMVFAGVGSVLVLFYLGRRMFGPPVGFVAAGLAALNPWHLQLSRSGFEAGLWILCVPSVLALMVRARLPVADPLRATRRSASSKARLADRPQPLPAVAAGLVAGMSCYGYPAGRIFLPVFLLACMVVDARRWWGLLAGRRGAAALFGFGLTFTVLLAPLLYKHVTEPDVIGKRGRSQLLWNNPLAKERGPAGPQMLERYADHFSPGFLWVRGCPDPILHVPRWGQFHWYALPGMVLGAVALIHRSGRSTSARVLLVWVLAYPVGDILAFTTFGSHPLRSAPGLGGLILLAAVGVQAAWSFFRRRRWKRIGLICAGLAAAAVLAVNGLFWRDFYGTYNHLPDVYHPYFEDLKQASLYLRPRLRDTRAVFWTPYGMNQPSMITLVHLNYPPEKWFAVAKDIRTPGEFDVCVRYGRMHFMYGRWWVSAWRELAGDGEPDEVYVVLRPNQDPRGLGLGEPVFQARRPDGPLALVVYRKSL